MGTLQVDGPRETTWAAVPMNEVLLFGSRTLSLLKGSGTFRAVYPRSPGRPAPSDRGQQLYVK